MQRPQSSAAMSLLQWQKRCLSGEQRSPDLGADATVPLRVDTAICDAEHAAQPRAANPTVTLLRLAAPLVGCSGLQGINPYN